MCATGRSCRTASSTEQQVYGGITAGSPLRDLNHFTLNSQSDDSDPEMETYEPCTDDDYYIYSQCFFNVQLCQRTTCQETRLNSTPWEFKFCLNSVHYHHHHHEKSKRYQSKQLKPHLLKKEEQHPTFRLNQS